MFWGLNTTRNNAAGQIAISRRRDQIVVFSHLLRVASLVGVVLDGRLAVRLLDLAGIRVLGHAEEVVKLLGVALMSGKGVFEPWSAAEVDGRRRGGGAPKKKIQEETDVGSGAEAHLRAPGHAAEMHRDDCFLVGLSATLESGEFTTKLA